MRMPMQPSPLSGIAQRMNDTMMQFFLSQPSALERDYMQAGVDQRRAAVQTEQAKAQLAQQKFAAPGSIASAFQNMLAPPEAARPDPAMMGPMPQMSRDDAARQFLPGAVEGAAALNLGDLGKTMLALMANAPGTSNEAVTRAFAGAGHALGENQALLPERQDQIRTENFGQETAINNADNAAAMARQGSANAAAMSRTRLTADAMRPTGLARLLSEQAALPPEDPRRALYDQAIQKESTRSGMTVYGPDGQPIVQMGGDLPAGVKSKAVAAEIGRDNIVQALDRVDQFANNPANFGLGGTVTRAAQSMQSEAKSLLGAFDQDTGVVDRLAQSLPEGMQGFNPDLPAVDSELRMVAFQLKAIVGEDRLSNEDRRELSAIAGSSANTAEQVKARTAALRRMIQSYDISADNVLGAPVRQTPRPSANAPPMPNYTPRPDAPAAAAPSTKPRIRIDAQGRIVQ